ncbi:MAG: FAD-binding oxidoreductase [Nostocoides sp.]
MPTPFRPLWWEGLPPATPSVVELPASVDVAIVGGGYTGLWTAYYLLGQRPDARVVVLEAEHVGFGASGRNGGWVSALWPVGMDAVVAQSGRDTSRNVGAALRETVDEVGRVAADESIDADFVKGGTLVVARNRAQAARARVDAEQGSHWLDGTVWLDREEARERLAVTGVEGATFNPNCARVHPRRLVDGLAGAVRSRGGVIAEGARVATIEPGLVRLVSGQMIKTRTVIRATEAWTARLPGLRRRVAPVYSLMVATAPISEHLWDSVGLQRFETFSDHRHVIIYGQRTADNRIAFGGRGAPYHCGSAISSAYDHDEAVFAKLRRTLTDLLPQLGDVEFTHAWGGPLGIARDWNPSVGLDASTGIGWAGGYVGDGVAATNLAGRTLADLICGVSSPITTFPWVGHRSPDWEPEPLRWLGINAGLRIAAAADREEQLTGRPALLGRALAALTAH